MTWKNMSSVPTDRTVWLTDGVQVVRAQCLGPYKTGYAIAGMFGWFSLTHWMEAEEKPLPPERGFYNA